MVMSQKAKVFLVVLSLYSGYAFCMEAPPTASQVSEQTPATGIFITFTQEGKVIQQQDNFIKMPVWIAKVSGLFNSMIEDTGGIDQQISVPNIDPQQFSLISRLWFELAELELQLAGKSKEEKLQEQISRLERPLSNYTFDQLYPLMQLISFFDIQPLLHAACSEFAKKIDSLEKIEKVLALESKEQWFKDIAPSIAHYIMKHQGILEELVKLSRGKGERALLCNIQYNSDPQWWPILGMQSTSINDKGDVALCFQNSANRSLLYIYNSTNKSFRWVNLPPFNIDTNVPDNALAKYRQLSCALSPDGKMVACIGKIGQKIQLLVINDGATNPITYDTSELKEFPLFSTFSVDGKKLCVASGDDIYMYEVANFDNKQPLISLPLRRPSTAEQFCSHIYDGNPCLIVINETWPKGFMLNLNNPVAWQEMQELEEFGFAKIMKSAEYKRNQDIIEASGFARLNDIRRDALNFYTYQLCAFLPESEKRECRVMLIDIVAQDVRSLIKAFNSKNIDLDNALYLCAHKIQKWNTSTLSMSTANTLFSEEKILPYVKTCVNISTRPMPDNTAVGDVTKSQLIKGHMGRFSFPFIMTAMLAGMTAALASHERWLAPVGFFGIGLGALAQLKTAYIESRNRYPDPQIQKLHTLLRYLRYGLGAATGIGFAWFASKYHR